MRPMPRFMRLARLTGPVVNWYNHGMKTAISLPDDLFESADALAERLGVSRSQLYQSALAEYLAKHQSRQVTERLNAVYARTGSKLDPALARLQSRTLKRDQW